ncbi:hypothetical protein [Pseudonocardia sp.]|jgi:hypothetical protein|uniref:hypothetical protein n=1 Tax=Pseudonocardia sp. TaxID=60912 RepID=UPI003D0C9771
MTDRARRDPGPSRTGVGPNAPSSAVAGLPCATAVLLALAAMVVVAAGAAAASWLIGPVFLAPPLRPRSPP